MGFHVVAVDAARLKAWVLLGVFARGWSVHKVAVNAASNSG
jgi:hypothetical protein